MLRAISLKPKCIRPVTRSFHAVPRALTSKSLENVTSTNKVKSINESLSDFSPEDVEGSTLPFNILKHSETYGQLVRSEHESVDDTFSESKIKVIDRQDFIAGNYFADNSREDELKTRYLPETLDGKFLKYQIQLPEEIAKAIHNNIIGASFNINTLRRTAARMFVSMSENGLHQPPRTQFEVDAYIATIFLQNYASAHQVLSELKSKIEQDGGKFNPKKILDVGYGPATGMIALNEIMGNDFKPELKHANITGVARGVVEMKERAKILLSRQLNEVPLEKLSPEQQREVTKKEAKIANNEIEEEHEDVGEKRKKYKGEDDYIGPVDTKRIKTCTKLVDSVPGNQQYDLIIVTHQLLKDAFNFPFGIDDAIEYYLRFLLPGGHLVILERGNPLGFEIIARARQIMIRPENYSKYEFGKIPRPWIRGSTIKPQKQYVPTEEDLKVKETLDKKFGAVDESDLAFEKDLTEAFDLEEVPKQGQAQPPIKSDYYLKVVAPYPNHLKCPLQMQNPRYYNYSKGSNLNWLNFSASVSRPRFSIEFKKGSILAAKWEKPGDGVAPRGLVGAGSGRPNGRNFEKVNFNYLIMQRTKQDKQSILEFEQERERIKKVTEEIDAAEEAKNFKLKDELVKAEVEKATSGKSSEYWPRIIRSPMKRKGHVIIHVLTFDGNIEKWIIPRSIGKDIYHDARKATKGDNWCHGYKTRTILFGSNHTKHTKTQYEKYYETFKEYEMAEKKQAKKLKKENKKIEKKARQQQEIQELYDINSEPQELGNSSGESNAALEDEDEVLEAKMARNLRPYIEEYENKLKK